MPVQRSVIVTQRVAIDVFNISSVAVVDASALLVIVTHQEMYV